MPTATEFWGFSAQNLGPLTTTYTAPSSCATGTDRRVWVNASDPVRWYNAPTCGLLTFGDCVPSGSSWDSFRQQTTEFVQGRYAYYSPGLACPSGWRTVGTLAHGDGNSDKASASGALATPKWEEFAGPPVLLHPTEFWLGFLEPSETLAFCCPSNYQADAFGQCVSILGPTESYTYSEMCLTLSKNMWALISTWDGTTLGDIQLISVASQLAEPSTTLADFLLTGTAVREYWAIGTYVPAVPLVYKESDKEDSKDDKDDDKGDKNDNKDADDDNAASVTTPRHGLVSVLGITLGLLAGVGILL